MENVELKYRSFKDHLNPFFVETGSYMGDGISAALISGFPNVISIDIDQYNFNQCVARFNDTPNVNIMLGDSATCLYDVIKHFDGAITFWLDAHYSGEETPSGLVKMPILYELNQIRRHHIKHHTIIIDDVSRWMGVSSERDFTIDNIVDTLMNINRNYQIYYTNGSKPQDILIAHP